MSFIQINVNHCQAVQDLLSQTIREKVNDVARNSEPYQHISCYDVNPWALEWGNWTANAKGRALPVAFAEVDVVRGMVRNSCAFRGKGLWSKVDVQYMSATLVRRVAWRFSEG